MYVGPFLVLGLMKSEKGSKLWTNAPPPKKHLGTGLDEVVSITLACHGFERAPSALSFFLDHMLTGGSFEALLV